MADKGKVIYIPEGCELSSRTADEEIEQYFYAVYHWARADSRAKIFHIRGNLELIIGAILEQNKDVVLNESWDNGNAVDFEVIKKREKRSNVRAAPRIQAILDYITLHPTEKYSSQKLCEMADLGETAFRKLFKKHTGKAPNEYIRDMRLTTAARMLLVSNRQVNDIAFNNA